MDVSTPSTQYSDDRNLRARQSLWEYQTPRFDLVTWTLELAAVAAGMRVLDVGCGNGTYLRALIARGVDAVGCDLSFGMLQSAPGDASLVNNDASALPFATAAFDAVIAPHMLYHVDDRVAAAHELRRVLRDDGVCVAVTNGIEHIASLRALVEAAASDGTPGWKLRNPESRRFSLENGEEQLRVAFESVACVRAEGAAPIVADDADAVADYVASIGDLYQPEVTRPWVEVVDRVRESAQAIIDRDGAFVIRGDTGAFVCRR